MVCEGQRSFSPSYLSPHLVPVVDFHSYCQFNQPKIGPSSISGTIHIMNLSSPIALFCNFLEVSAMLKSVHRPLLISGIVQALELGFVFVIPRMMMIHLSHPCFHLPFTLRSIEIKADRGRICMVEETERIIYCLAFRF